MSWRIVTNEIDRSQTVSPVVGTIGAMVMRGSKGRAEPVLVSKADENRIITLFGKPSSTYPDVQEAIEYNKEASIWLSAPYASGDLCGGVLVTEVGTVALGTGIAPASISSYTFSNQSIATSESLGTGDGSTTVFTATLTAGMSDPTADLDFAVDGVAKSATVAGTTPNFTITQALLSSGTYNATTGVMTLTFSAAPADGAAITAEYTANAEVYFALFSRSPYATDDLGVKVTYNSTNTFFTILTYQKDASNNWILKDTQAEVSTTVDKKNPSGANVYVENIYKLENSDWLIAKNNTSATSTAFIDDTSAVALYGGSRTAAASITITELTTGWNYFQQKNTYAANIFMDPTAISGVVSLFDTLRSTYQKYASYILTIPYGQSVATAIATKQGYSLNNRGLAVFWNWGRVQDFYNNSSFWSSLVGRIGRKYAQMDNIFNAGAPAFVDENSHGGQLGSGIIELENDPSETNLESMDTAGLNPIVFDQNYGVFISSQKTAQSPNTLSDYSYISHSRLFDYIIKNIESQVLIYQLVKLNDDAHRKLVYSKTDTILSPILAGGYLSDYAIRCDNLNNTSAILAQRKFVLDVAVQVTPYSEQIIFNFVAAGQTVSVNEVIG